MSGFSLDEQQLNVVSAIREYPSHVSVTAGPGSGKTRVLLEALSDYQRPGPTLVAAFTRSVRDTFAERTRSRLECATVHQLAYRLVQGLLGRRLDMEDSKVYSYIRQEFHREISKRVFDDNDVVSAAQLLALGKTCLSHSGSDLKSIAAMNELSVGDCSDDVFERLFLALLRSVEDTRVLDFNDIIYIAVTSKFVRVPKFHTVVIDEAQDLSPALQLLLLKHLDPKVGRLISVGDPHQAIYGFAGANKDSIASLATLDRTKCMLLGRSYRCARSIIDYTRQQIPSADYLEARPGAPQGLVERVSARQAASRLEPGDLVLARSAGRLGKIWTELRRLGKPCRLYGKEHLKKIETAVKGSKSLEQTLSRLRKTNASLAQLAAAAEASTPDELLAKVKRAFTDQPEPREEILLSTTHAMKGRERRRVAIDRDSFMKGPDAVEERNILYVACTRAKEELLIIE